MACIKRTPKSLFGEALLVHNHFLHKPPIFRLGTSGYAGSPKTPRSYSEIRELFLNEFTTSIDNTKHPINLLAVVQKSNETTRKYIDEFRKQLTTKSVWTRKDMQVISKEFIHREEVNRVVTATKNPQAHTAPRGQGKPHHPRDNHRETGSRGNPKQPKQKFDHYTPLVASITEIYTTRFQKRASSRKTDP
ncbi:hypothetical protein PIB30_075618 [Stylosanthes scabra]|uniref:Retrotransposon gag domain-containing protein n=1 Tax=Stylosanthes scabra TaxID=79078 RepID=A0ABU6SRL1_9FABA|nr:hypothetical protein [Stylosanthes scabra]